MKNLTSITDLPPVKVLFHQIIMSPNKQEHITYKYLNRIICDKQWIVFFSQLLIISNITHVLVVV